VRVVFEGGGVKFLSVCSGIEAASVAWNPLGWKAAAFSEIEPFPCSLLKHHYPDTPNRGDMTKFKDWPNEPIDLLCGGTPCQSFSVAGLRAGLADPRGNLMLTFGAIAAKYRPQWLVWENVPGVLSSNGGRDFGSFLGLLGELGYGFAYRVLDAQYFGVPQRRRRVFVVGCFGDWRSAAAVLFERHSLSGNPAPRRQAWKGTSRGIEFGPSGGRFTDVNPTLDTRAQDGPVRNQLAGCVGTLCVATGQAGADMAPTLNCNHEAPYIAHSLRGEGFDASEDGTGRGTPLVPVVSPTLDQSAGRSGSHSFATSGGLIPVAYRTAGDGAVFEEGDVTAPLTTGTDPSANIVHSVALRGRDGGATAELGDDQAFALRASSGGGDKPHVMASFRVRRLTPRECERLQGFPDEYTLVPHRGKPAADGPRYKALGNSWAIPNVRWIGERIEMVSAIQTRLAA
jgi:DNA (cytosine-5)-methyltransferase 1